MNVDYRRWTGAPPSLRRENRQPIDKGGWSGLSHHGRASTCKLRSATVPGGMVKKAGSAGRAAHGSRSWRCVAGYCGSCCKKQIAEEIQRQWWIDVPHLPIGYFPANGMAEYDGRDSRWKSSFLGRAKDLNHRIMASHVPARHRSATALDHGGPPVRQRPRYVRRRRCQRCDPLSPSTQTHLDPERRSPCVRRYHRAV